MLAADPQVNPPMANRLESGPALKDTSRQRMSSRRVYGRYVNQVRSPQLHLAHSCLSMAPAALSDCFALHAEGMSACRLGPCWPWKWASSCSSGSPTLESSRTQWSASPLSASGGAAFLSSRPHMQIPWQSFLATTAGSMPHTPRSLPCTQLCQGCKALALCGVSGPGHAPRSC